MGKLDILCKKYMSDNEIFADAFNYLIYDGKQKIKPNELRPLDTSSISIEIDSAKEPSIVQKNRDVVKLLSAKRTNEIGFMILGVENQATINYAMSVRIMLYDAMCYAEQVDLKSKENRKSRKFSDSNEFISGFAKGDKLIPVITLVVYFGSKTWDAPTNIKDMFIDVDESVKKYLPNYRINLISPHLPDSELAKLKSELGVVMQFIKNSNDKKKLMESLDKNKRFHNISKTSATLIKETTGLNLKINKDKEKIDMCKAVKDMIYDATKAAKEETKAAKEETKAAKEETKAAKEETKAAKKETKTAKLRIKELEAQIKKLQAQLKAA